MPQTQVRSPDGEVITVQHPEGATEQEIIAYAQRNAVPAQVEQPRALFSGYGPYKGGVEETVGLGEKALSLVTGAIAAPLSGLGGIAAGLIPGGRTGSEAVSEIGSALTYSPKTEVGQRQIGRA